MALQEQNKKYQEYLAKKAMVFPFASPVCWSNLP